MKAISKRLFTLIFCFVSVAAFAMGSKEAPETTAEEPVTQGVEGKVEIWEGNFMPMTDTNSAQNSITPGAGLKIRVHEPVKMGASANATLTEVPTPMIAETTTDEEGKFFIELEPGSYSIFVEENGGWYFNGWSGEGVQGAVEIAAGETENVLIKITTNATF